MKCLAIKIFMIQGKNCYKNILIRITILHIRNKQTIASMWSLNIIEILKQISVTKIGQKFVGENFINF